MKSALSTSTMAADKTMWQLQMLRACPCLSCAWCTATESKARKVMVTPLAWASWAPSLMSHTSSVIAHHLPTFFPTSRGPQDLPTDKTRPSLVGNDLLEVDVGLFSVRRRQEDYQQLGRPGAMEQLHQLVGMEQPHLGHVPGMSHWLVLIF